MNKSLKFLSEISLSLLVFLVFFVSLASTKAQAQAPSPLTHALTCTPPPADPEIKDLARALNYNLELIYEYVYYGIDYSTSFGLMKGPLGTFLDRRGNNMDQNVLFATLLRQSCIRADYRYSVLTVPAEMIANLIGVENSATRIAHELGNGGIPACVKVEGNDQCVDIGGPAKTVSIQQVLTDVTLGGKTYQFDPSFKSYQHLSPINAATAMGFDKTEFLAAATKGSSSVSGLPANIQSIRNLNRDNIRAKLNAYTETLANEIRKTHTSKSMADIFGGRTITDSNYLVTFSSNGTRCTEIENCTPVPNALKSAFTVKISDTPSSPASINMTFYSDQISGKRLTLNYNNANQPVLTLDGTVIATGSATKTKTQLITTTLSTPYVNANDETRKQVVDTGGTYSIILAAGDIGRDTLTHHQNATLKARAAGKTGTSEAVLGAGLAAVGYAYLSQSVNSNLLIANLGGFNTRHDYAVGVAGYNGSTYVDFPLYNISSSGKTRAISTRDLLSSVFNMGIFASFLESSSVKQIQEVEAVSTTRMFDYSNTSGIGFLEATPRNWPAVKRLLVNWTASDLARMEASLAGTSATNRKVFVPQNGLRAVNTWNGNGYYLLANNEKQLTLVSKISGGFNGGFASEKRSWLGDKWNMLKASAQSAYQSFKSADPVDLRSGYFLYDHEDISTGSAAYPFGLSLTRSYSSGQGNTKTALGYGWRHNFMLDAKRDSDPYEAFGQHNPLAAVTTIVAAQVIQDLGTDLTLTNTAISSIIGSWLMDQLVDNAITVQSNEGTQKFIKIPTAAGGVTFVPPPGDGSTLTLGQGDSVTITDKTGIITRFDKEGDIQSWEDKNRNTVTFAYSGTGKNKNLTTVSNGMGRKLTFSYNGNNQLTSVSDGSRSVSYGYDGKDNLISFKNTLNNTYHYGYEGSGLITTMYNPAFPKTTTVRNTYDHAGRVQTQADPFGNVWHYLFANGRRAQETDPRGNSRFFYYDRNGNLLLDVSQTRAGTRYTYNGIGLLTQRVDSWGLSQSFTYDDKANILTKTVSPAPKVIDNLTGIPPVPITEKWTYSALSLPVTHTDFLGRVTKYDYNGQGNLIKTTQAGVAKSGITGTHAPVTLTTYNARGLPVTTTDPEGRVLQNTYDPHTFDLVSTTLDPGTGRLNLTTAYTYDAAGNQIAEKDPRGYTTGYLYDAERRLTRVTAPDGKGMTQYVYDPNGNLSETKIATGEAVSPFLVTKTHYNAANNPLIVTEPDGKTTITTYDALNRVDTVTSSSGRRTRLTYDAASRPVDLIDEMANGHDASITKNPGTVVRETRSYTLSGHLSTLTDANNNTIKYKYDGFARQSELHYPDGAYDLRAFNAQGNEIVFQRRDKSQIGYEYDNLDRLIKKKLDNQNITNYEYDYSGRLLSLIPSANPELAVSYTYDTAGRPTSETTPLFGTTQFTLDNNGNRVSMTLPSRAGGLKVTRVYDTLNRLTGVYQGTETAPPIVNYTYDPAGRRTRAVYGNPSSPLAETTLNYNQASLPATLTHRWNGSQLDIGYQYNADRQKTRVTFSDSSFAPAALPDLHQTYQSNNLNQYTAINDSAPEYDKRGNLIRHGEWSYAYDKENRLVSAEKAGMKLEFGYDALSRRVIKKVTKDNVTTTYAYLSIGDQEMAVFSGIGAVDFTGAYLYGAGLDEVVADITTRGQNFYFQDALGSTIALTNAQGAVIEKHGYTAYGLESVSGSNNAAFRFAGRRIDPETGLSYNRARYYSPTLGRFLQTDPAGIEGGLNLYAYVGNDPVNFIDPTGQWGETVSLGLDALPVVGALKGGYEFFREPSWINAGVAVAGIVPGGKVAAKGAKWASKAGREGEAAVKSVYNIGDKRKISVGEDRYRIPDGIHTIDKTLNEVKNVKRQGLTRQLKDYSAYAQEKNLDFNLFIRPDTKVSKPLQEQIDKGLIKRKDIP
ncbi:putative Rhs family protein [Xenorhabdus nematophila ATCC 19061]|uniref:Rhs family protein n=1 Tax=Xenorhabdus nematophila (strain ATCC 19061 / DSM 3370 / CCUG 14189 / LMG 1036 / NCIMB 9965 / AN6) TaxID=406817 RepID=D3VJR4_XENNA|nr:putative toxin [Xenorhabdus nematophila]CBJ90973.1 putative Rhs family protein [Xenorhabdus nematophila ATCC 19061]CEK23799.1 putative Rhs family protein [Xenorhabdus nematophila AN6/1]